MDEAQKHLNDCCTKWRALNKARIAMAPGPAKKDAETEEYRALRKVANATDSLVKKQPSAEAAGQT